MNTFGRNLRLSTFGESHGPAMGGIIDGFPPNFKIDFDRIDKDLAKRRPGTSLNVTQRKEGDKPEFLSGINEEGITLGTPIGFIVRNQDTRSSDYDSLKDVFRPSHADYTYMKRYGLRDHRGGGRASARETVSWVIAGSIANQYLEQKGIFVEAVLTGAGNAGPSDFFGKFSEKGFENITALTISQKDLDEIETEIQRAKKDGDSIGGRVGCLIRGLPPGIGNPVADKLQARLAEAMMSINAAKGFEYGIGIKASYSRGSDIADSYMAGDFNEGLTTSTNYSGGIQGGISNGMPIFFSVYFKPTPSISIPQKTADIFGHEREIIIKGRHDPCVALRAVEIVKAMTALVICDFII